MPPRRRVDPAAGRAALAAWDADPEVVSRDVVATAVRHTLAELAERYPGHAVEVRVPPVGAVQCLEGIRHRRGTPPNVVETDPATWLSLVTRRTTWAAAVESGAISASGDRADISELL
ncbi:MAG TPA: sterol carrier family protein [Sporichthya sp.]|nr:sterol carrier family protein [Sporichthya sp.]